MLLFALAAVATLRTDSNPSWDDAGEWCLDWTTESSKNAYMSRCSSDQAHQRWRFDGSTSASDAGTTPKSAITPSKDEFPIGAIIGGGLGAVALLAVAAVAIVWLRTKAQIPTRTDPTVVTGIPAATEMTPSKV